MGAWGTSFQKCKSKEQCRQRVTDFCENEDSSTKDVEFHDRNFKTLQEAQDFVESRVDKWGPAVAASYLGTPSELKDSASKRKFEDLRKAAIPAKEREISFQLNVMGELRSSSEVEYVKCPGCGSKINSKHLNGIGHYRPGDTPIGNYTYGCPACHGVGLIPKFLSAEIKKLQKLVSQRNDLEEKLKALWKKIEDENPRETFWYVSVYVPS